MVESIMFIVYGTPVPQGSTKSFYIPKVKKVVTTHGNKSTGQWRQRIATEAQAVQEAQGFYSDDRTKAYHVFMDFDFPKPKSTPKRIVLNTKRPDIDKLVRAVLDGITGILIPDDAQVIGIHATKHYCEPGDPPGLTVSVLKVENKADNIRSTLE